MKRCFTLVFLMFSASLLPAQEFVLVEDSSNPINQVSLRGFYRGCAWVDLDNDGDLDLTTEGYAFRNDGEEIFSLIEGFGTEGEATDVTDFLGGVSWADYDNDGDKDCLYSTASILNGSFDARTFIYDNDGTGNFSVKMIDGEQPLKTWSAAWGEYNNDGYVDVTGAVAFGFLQGFLDTPGFFYKGNAEGSFTKIDTFEFTQQTAPYTVAYWIDYDDDGDSDLFLASGPGGSPGPDFHYQNLLSETGTEGLMRITDTPFATDSQDGQAYNFIDYDLDGDRDLLLTNYSGAPNRFYQNDAGTFTAISNALTFAGPTLGNCWGDFDNDGDEDVLITSDNINQAGYFRNDQGEFIAAGNPFEGVFPAASSNVSGLTIGDYDNDGDLDFFANGGVNGASGPRALYRNELDTDNHWANFRCEGNPSNRAAIGTRLRLKASINGEAIWQQREISAQNTFMGHNSQRAHFGLGNAEVIDSLILEWPSGNVEHYANLAIDSFYQVVEGEPLISNTKQAYQLVATSLDIQPNPADSGATQIRNVFFEEKGNIQVQIMNTSGQLVASSTFTSEQWIRVATGQLESGVYLIRLISGNRIATSQLVVQ